jgi:hypothetical protein
MNAEAHDADFVETVLSIFEVWNRGDHSVGKVVCAEVHSSRGEALAAAGRAGD